jgi:hypothetical protein
MRMHIVAFNLSPAACLEALNVSSVRSVIPSPGQSYSEPLHIPSVPSHFSACLTSCDCLDALLPSDDVSRCKVI